MASRILTPSLRTAIRNPFLISTTTKRTFTSSLSRRADAVVAPVAPAAPVVVRKPVGAFRGGVFGFLLGSTLAGAATWFYIMEEYRVSNELLTEDIYALQAAVQRIHTLMLGIEERVEALDKKARK